MNGRPCSRRRHHDGGLNRRSFLGTLGAAAAGMLVTPPTHAARGGRAAAARVAVASSTAYDRAHVHRTMAALFDSLGGLSDIIRPGDRVGIKINLTGGLWNASNFERQVGLPPGDTYWTHPEVLRSVGQLVRDSGAGTVYVLEANGEDWPAFADYGYVRAVSDFDGRFINLNAPSPAQSYAIRSTGPNAFIYASFRQNVVLDELDCLISLAKSKQHAEAGVTHGMKNLVGSVPLALYNGGAGSRQELHRHTSYEGNRFSNLCRVVLDLNGATPIGLVVNDVVKTVLGGEGPWHVLTPANFETFVASKDPVAADVVATQVMGLDPAAGIGSATFPDSLNYLRLAADLGMGNADMAQIDVVDATLTDSEREDPGSSSIQLTAYPNPFDAHIKIDVDVRASAYATLMVYDIRGRLVETLLARFVAAGRTSVEWAGRTSNGARVPPGVYLVRLQVGSQTRSAKVVHVH